MRLWFNDGDSASEILNEGSDNRMTHLVGNDEENIAWCKVLATDSVYDPHFRADWSVFTFCLSNLKVGHEATFNTVDQHTSQGIQPPTYPPPYIPASSRPSLSHEHVGDPIRECSTTTIKLFRDFERLRDDIASLINELSVILPAQLLERRFHDTHLARNPQSLRPSTSDFIRAKLVEPSTAGKDIVLPVLLHLITENILDRVFKPFSPGLANNVSEAFFEYYRSLRSESTDRSISWRLMTYNALKSLRTDITIAVANEFLKSIQDLTTLLSESGVSDVILDISPLIKDKVIKIVSDAAVWLDSVHSQTLFDDLKVFMPTSPTAFNGATMETFESRSDDKEAKTFVVLLTTQFGLLHRDVCVKKAHVLISPSSLPSDNRDILRGSKTFSQVHKICLAQEVTAKAKKVVSSQSLMADGKAISLGSSTAHDAASHNLNVANDEADLIAKLSAKEEDLWIKYGFTGDLDSEKLFKECLKRAQEGREEGVIQDAKMLSNLSAMRKSYSPQLWRNAEYVEPGGRIMAKSSRIWALIIGNNHYSNPQQLLQGCHDDAQEMKHYLQDYLCVPSDHIQLVLDARRKQMVDALYALRDNALIHFGDNILFYFAGHGSTYDAADHFQTDLGKLGSIEALCPSDRMSSVPDISDRELNHILREIRSAKGPNITVILDCCYSGGAVRDTTICGRARFIPPLPACAEPQCSALTLMLEAADSDPRRAKSLPSIAQSETWDADVSSFVLLAACQEYQRAEEFEDKKSQHGPRQRGLFTCALLKILESKEADGATFESIIHSIGQLSHTQKPAIVGTRKNSRLWFADDIDANLKTDNQDRAARPKK
ncbi:hypothetical protein CVT26_007399 [Gymnopilus dilepis]|uniref:Peptidase C14 caspase domain-containing protein n=1 Tax=Gymnopilus dilepis TaxID=231916 RepID=A0A409WTF8_9AGAR|nr:hypothetical protein CVT26_007399 [Gymnopilus dilepis]